MSKINKLRDALKRAVPGKVNGIMWSRDMQKKRKQGICQEFLSVVWTLLLATSLNHTPATPDVKEVIWLSITVFIKGHDNTAEMEIEPSEQNRAKKRKYFSFWLPSTGDINWIDASG